MLAPLPVVVENAKPRKPRIIVSEESEIMVKFKVFKNALIIALKKINDVSN